MLIKRGFVHQFDSGVVAILHWKINNRIQKDRYKPTVYTKEMSCLNHDNSLDNVRTQSGHNLDTQYSIGENSVDKGSSDKFNSGETSIAKPSALLLAKDIKNRNDIMRVYANNFKLDLCDFVIETLTEQAFSDRQVKGHCASEFRDFAENYFDAEALARLVNKLIAAKEIADKRSYLLTIIAEEYL